VLATQEEEEAESWLNDKQYYPSKTKRKNYSENHQQEKSSKGLNQNIIIYSRSAIFPPLSDTSISLPVVFHLFILIFEQSS
jgi:hypothetical protein